MPRSLKVFRAHLGFYDTVVAAPSQKAALEAWGAGKHEFAQGFAGVTEDTQAVEAALRNPGVVLRRPAGSKGAFKVEPEAPIAPRLTASQKRRMAQAKHKTVAGARAAAKRAKQQEARRAASAQAELAEIESAEAKLRERRRTIERSIKPRVGRKMP